MFSHVGLENSSKNSNNIPTICLDAHSDSMSDGGYLGLQEIGSRFFEEGSTTNIHHFLSWISCLGAYKKYVVTCVLLSRCEPCFRTGARIVNGWSPSTCISGSAVDYDYLNSVNVSRTSDSVKIIAKLLELLSHFSNNLSHVEKNSFGDYHSDSVTSQNSSETPFMNCSDDEIPKAFDIKQRYIQLTLELIATPSSFSNLVNELSNRKTEIHDCELREAVVQLPITCLILSLLLHPSFNHEERTSLLMDIRAYVKSVPHGLLTEDKDVPFLEGLPTNFIDTCQHSVNASIKTALSCKILGYIMELATDTWYVLQYFQNGPMCLATSRPHSLTSSGFLSGSGDGGSESQYDLLSEAATVNTSGGYSGSSMNGGSHYGTLLTVPHPLSMDSRHSFSGCATTTSLVIDNTCGRRRLSSTTTSVEENAAHSDSLPCSLRKHGTSVTNDTRGCDVNATNLVATTMPCDKGDIPAHRLSSSVCTLATSLEKPRNKCSLFQQGTIDGMTISSAKVGTASRFLYATGRTQVGGSNQTIGIESANKVTYMDPTSGMMGVPAWLKSLRLHKYAGLFQHLTYTEFMNIDEAWLEHQNVTRGARNKLLLSIYRLASRRASLSLAESLLTQAGSTATIAGVQAIHACLSEVGSILQTPLKPCHCVAPHAAESTGKRPTGIPPIVFSTGGEADVSSTMPDEADHLPESVGRFPLDLVGAAADKVETDTDCLPCRIIGCLSKVCSRLLVNPQLDTECCNRFMHILDVIGTHQAFLDRHKSLTISWLRSMFAGRNTWLERDSFPGGDSCILSSLHSGNTSISHLPTTGPPKDARPIYRTSGAHQSKDYSSLMMRGRSHCLTFSDRKAPGACFHYYPEDGLSPGQPAGSTSSCLSAGECRRHSVPLSQTGKQPGQSTKPRCLRRMPSPGASITSVGLDHLFPSSPNRSSSPSSYLLPVRYPLSPPPRRRPPAILLTRSSLDVSAAAAVRLETASASSLASSMPPLGSLGGPLLPRHSPQLVVGQHLPRHGSGSSPTGCCPVLFPPATAPPTRMPSPSSDMERWRYRQQLQLAAAQMPTGWIAVPDWHNLSQHCQSPTACLASRYEEEEFVTAVRLARDDGHQLLASDCGQTAAEKNSLSDCMLPILRGHTAGSVASQVYREVGSLNPTENAAATALWLTTSKVDFPGHPIPTLSRSSDCTEHIEHDLDVLTREVTELAIGDLDSPVG